MSSNASLPSRIDVVGSMQYDPKVQRRSLEDPHRQHRRSSIPFADRKPAVRFIRAIEQKKASISGPHGPQTSDAKNKPILKKSDFPILVNALSDIGLTGSKGGTSSTFSSTNDELETCRFKTELIMDKISRIERIARGALDVLTFPTSTRRVDPLSRYQGCMTISVCVIDYYTKSEEYVKSRRSSKDSDRSNHQELSSVLEIAQSMAMEAQAFSTTAKKFLHISLKRYNEWDMLLKRSTEFKIDHSRLRYPIYTHKKMPESVTLFEDSLEASLDPQNNNAIDGYIRIYRKFPEGTILLYCDLTETKAEGEGTDESNTKSVAQEPINFMGSSNETQLDIIKYLVSHGKDLLFYANCWLKQGLEALQDVELDETFLMIQKKINSLQYDEYFDPLVALEFKAGLGELIARKAELLNTAEQASAHCKWITKFAKTFQSFTRRRVKGGGALLSFLTCSCGGNVKSTLFQQLGMVGVEDVTILMPLTLEIYQDVFHINPFQIVDSSDGDKDNVAGSEPPKTTR